MYARSGFFRTNWNDRIEAIRRRSLSSMVLTQHLSKDSGADRHRVFFRTSMTAGNSAVQKNQR